MYSLLIVDDEAGVTDSIAGSIPWDDIGITEVFRAYNGEEAAEILDTHRIDVVLSDIQMPKMDGIALAQEVRRRFAHTKLIFMTVYDDFGYAREAIAQGVFGYILKPAADAEILELAAAALEQVRREIETQQALENIEQKIAAAKPIIQQRLLNNFIVSGRTGAEQFFAQAREAGFAIQAGGVWTLYILRLDGAAEPGTGFEKRRIILINLIQKLLLQNQEAFIFDDDDGNLALALGEKCARDEAALEAASRRIKDIWEIFYKSVKKAASLEVSLFGGAPPVPFQNLHELYLSIRGLMLRFIPADEGILVLSGEASLRPGAPPVFSVLEEYPPLRLLIDTLDAEGTQKKLEKIFSFMKMKTKNSAPAEMMIHLYYEIAGLLLQGARNRNIPLSAWAGDDEPFLYNFERFNSLAAFRDWCFRITARFLDYVPEELGKERSRLVRRAKQLVIRGMSENISVSVIAEKLSLSPSHLTRVFKQETGQSVIEYILERKMERAKEMLLDPGVKVYEVACALGYANLSNFNRLFRREMGCTPKEFQQRQTPAGG